MLFLQPKRAASPSPWSGQMAPFRPTGARAQSPSWCLPSHHHLVSHHPHLHGHASVAHDDISGCSNRNAGTPLRLLGRFLPNLAAHGLQTGTGAHYAHISPLYAQRLHVSSTHTHSQTHTGPVNVRAWGGPLESRTCLASGPPSP
ncbi:unnamed protein product [Periconia digitata]|uniref:Uncharacterized protein n=1 Tax=Periconia digitata TaxID=1303443 RepID=A0A9W4U5S4_9PLEO|nr:unnamed protein product [Periconia digitata]